MDRFIGRENELVLLRDLLSRPSASAMIYGKRKVGKTTLIREALKNSKDSVVYYECILFGFYKCFLCDFSDKTNGITRMI